SLNPLPLVLPSVTKKNFSPSFLWQPFKYLKTAIIFLINLLFSKLNIPMTSLCGKRKTKHMLPTGFKTFLGHSVKELEVLMMSNKSYYAEIAHNVSSKNRKVIAQPTIKITNLNARLRSEENE
uniref:60S ribosomal protein L32 n=1 Tax=Gopherus agassizii TaxID=38772 RepID=A0A452HQ21_9SAUR